MFFMASRAISLTDDELTYLTTFVKAGTRKARELTRARILLQSHEGDGSGSIASALRVTPKMVWEVRKRYEEGGLDRAIPDKSRPGQPRKVTSEVEAKVALIACESPPAGQAAWTISTIQDELTTRFGIAISFGSVQKVLKTHKLRPWKKRCDATRTSPPISSTK